MCYRVIGCQTSRKHNMHAQAISKSKKDKGNWRLFSAPLENSFSVGDLERIGCV